MAVKFGNEEIEVQTVFQRLKKGERGDDLPVVMDAFGVDYDTACDAVFNGRFDEATTLLRRAIAGSPESDAELLGNEVGDAFKLQPEPKNKTRSRPRA